MSFESSTTSLFMRSAVKSSADKSDGGGAAGAGKENPTAGFFGAPEGGVGGAIEGGFGGSIDGGSPVRGGADAR